MSFNHYFKIPIPDGYRIFYSEMDVAGAVFRMKAIKKAFSGKSLNLSIVPEPKNKHDKNALKVVATIKGFFGKKNLHIGYIPREIAADIADKPYTNILPRPKEIWIGDQGGLKIVIDLLGKKEAYIK